MSNNKQNTTMSARLNEIESRIAATFTAGDEKAVLELRTIIEKLAKRVGEIRANFDKAVDGKEMFGTDTFPNVTRIRAKSENVGRPKAIKPVDTTLDF